MSAVLQPASVTAPVGHSQVPRATQCASPIRPMSRKVCVVAVISAVLLIPCFWHSRIQAGDLSSHIYNAWLATLIESNQIDGLSIATQWTNVLFDLILFHLLTVVGVDAAQRVAVSLAVLVFFWGAFAFVSAVSRRPSWFAMPCLAILAYGWVFHMGFFNFYLSTGLCLWAIAFCWRLRLRHAWAAVPLFAAAFTAHALPAVWAVGVLIYVAILRWLRARDRILFTLSLLAFAMLWRPLLSSHMPILFEKPSFVSIFARMTGADQGWVFGTPFIFILSGLLIIWVLWFHQLAERHSFTRIAVGIPFQLWLLHSVGVLLLPAAIFPAGYNVAFSFIPERMTLMVAISTCAFLSTMEPAKLLKWLGVVIMGAFFALLYIHTGRLNTIEDKVTFILSRLPLNQRVIGPLCFPESRINALLHTVDRACLGHCYSFANYEPSSLQFRVRTTRRNSVVLTDRSYIAGIEVGKYVPSPAHFPVYLLRSESTGTSFDIRVVSAGEAQTSACTSAEKTKIANVQPKAF